MGRDTTVAGDDVGHSPRWGRPSAPLAGLLAVALSLICAPAAASEAIAATGRFEMHPSGDGVLRLDRITGEIALCTGPLGEVGWTCRTVVASAAPEAEDVGQGATALEPEADAARSRANAAGQAGREAARRLAGEAPADAGDIAQTVSPEADGQTSAPRDVRAEVDRLRQENARLSLRVDELERRLAHVAALTGGDVARSDAETDEAIADIDRAVRVGIYALARFRDLAQLLSDDETAGER